MRQILHRITVDTPGSGLVEVTGPIGHWVAAQSIPTGLLTIFCRHTSASLLLQENADPDVRADLEAFFRRLAPEAAGHYRHDAEGPDDMPAHIRAALTQSQLSIPVEQGRLTLGTWQGVYLFEHRAAPHRRELVLHLLGGAGEGGPDPIRPGPARPRPPATASSTAPADNARPIPAAISTRPGSMAV